MMRWSRVILVSVVVALPIAAGAQASAASSGPGGLRAAGVVGVGATTPAGQPVGTNRLVDVRPSGKPTRDGSTANSPSADGRYLSFDSADKVMTGIGHLHHAGHVYVSDLATGTVTLGDATPTGLAGNGDAGDGSLSADGRFLVFSSSASNLVRGDNDEHWDVFLRDTATGTTRLVSGELSDTSYGGQISDDGSTVVFVSNYSFYGSVYRYDVASGDVSLVSKTRTGHLPSEASVHPSVSGDGQLITYSSGSSYEIVSEPTSKAGYDVILYDVAADTSTLVSRPPTRERSTGLSLNPQISADGTTVVFESNAKNMLATGDVGGRHYNLYRRDLAAEVTTLISATTTGEAARQDSGSPDVDGTGRYVTFWSAAHDLVAGDDNRRTDAFVRDTTTGVTTLISHDAAGRPADGDSSHTTMASDASIVEFGSEARNLVAETHTRAPRVYAYRLS